MGYVILKAYEFLTVLLSFLVVFVGLAFRYKHRGLRVQLRHSLLVALFAVYIFAVFYVTGVSTLMHLVNNAPYVHWQQVQWLPYFYKQGGAGLQWLLQVPQGSWLNVLLFVPLGVLLPLVWPARYKLGRTLLTGFSFSLLIEVSQLFNNRVTDMDDLICNTLGAVAGYLMFRLAALLARCKPAKSPYPGWEAPLYIGVMFLGRFLLFNEMAAARLLFHF